jgi:hypothetical protein
MATASDLIKGEALIAQSGNINLGEEIGKGFETVAKSITEAKDTISSWSEKEAKLNDDMAQVGTDDLLSDENKIVSEFLTQGKQKYAEAARKASRIANKSSKKYKDLVKIMNDVNTSFKTLAKEKQDILDARAYVKENPNGFSPANSLREDSSAYLAATAANAPLTLNEKGHFIIENKEFRNLKTPSKKSDINKGIAQVLVKVYDASKKSNIELTENELENAGNAIVASIMGSDNRLEAAQQFLLDPIYGTDGLAKEEEVKGKEEKELIILAKDRYKQLLKKQSEKGKKDYVIPEEPESNFEDFYRTDGPLKSMEEFINGKGGVEEVLDGTSAYRVVKGTGETDEEKIQNARVYLTNAKGENSSNFINLYRKDPAGTYILNRLDFRSLTGNTTPIQRRKK